VSHLSDPAAPLAETPGSLLRRRDTEPATAG